MILKEADDRSHDIAELQRLKSIVPAGFRQKIQQQIDNIYSGIEGERSAAHFINREFGASEKIVILHDLRIGVDGDYAQIDHLLIHRFQGAAWVLETKNFSGRLNCDEHGDWTVWNGRFPTPIASPVNQARRHCQTLRLWLKQHGIKAIHDIHPVVLISPTSSIKRNKLADDKCVVKSDNFGKWFDDQANKLGVSKILGMLGRAAIHGLSKDEMIVLGKRLAYAHTPSTYDWRSMLRLPIELNDPAKPAVQVMQLAPQEPTTAPTQSYDAILHPLPPIPTEEPTEEIKYPDKIETPHGFVHLRKLPDGQYALRNEANESLIEIVRKACKGTGKWNPRYRNWIVSEADLLKVLAAL